MRDQHRYRRINWTRLVLILTGCIVLAAGGYFIYNKYFKPIEYVVRPGESIQKVLDEMPGGTNIWEKVSRPSEPGLLVAGATAFSIK